MDFVRIRKQIGIEFAKYKYAVVILCIGLVLMLLPGKTNAPAAEEAFRSQSEAVPLQQQLEQILAQIDGVGKACVLLTERTGAETLYQSDESQSTSETGSNYKLDTIILTDSSRNQSGLVRKTVSATYQGAIIVCQGGGNPAVRLAVAQAVSNITGLGTNQISVVKMK